MIKEKIKKYFKSIIITAAFIVASLAIGCQPSNATDYPYWAGSETGGMPSNGTTDPTGLFPQLLNVRQFYGSADTEFPYEDWTIDVSAGVVYCANQGTILRFGKKDPNIYYPEAGTMNTYSAFEEAQAKKIEQKARKQISDAGGSYAVIDTPSVSYVQTSGTAIDIGQTLFFSKSNGGMSWVGIIRYEMQKIMGMLAGTERPPDLYGNGWENYNHPGSVLDYDGSSAEFGPTVCVMESGGSRGYSKAGSGTAINDQMAYILTAMEDVYNVAPYQKYNESDIQSAYWLLVDSNVDTSHCTSNGFVLKQRAEEYERFVAEISGGYKATIDDSNAQVIVNQTSGNYIVGPFSITYPEYQDLSYVKALYITTDTGKTLIYDENNEDLEILCETGSTLHNNGQLKTYPSSGEYFYIKFSAAKAGYPKDIELYADFEYLSKVEIDYNDLRAQANIYQYFGYCTEGGEHPARVAYGSGTVSYTYKKYEIVRYDPISCTRCAGTGIYPPGPCIACGGSGVSGATPVWDWVEYSGSASVSQEDGEYSLKIVQPYIQMGEEPVQSLTGQPLTAALDGSRTYTIYEISTPIDLTFELGGKVWVDGTAGKESNFDGLYNTTTDTPMSNVKVTLYKQNGEKIAETKTDENGQYLFKHQNSMFQYYIKFTYNGQYYEPTIYNVDRDSENWNNTSKGLDILDENYISIAKDNDVEKVLDRDSFNIRFQEIGANPLNVNGMEVYTRDELYEKGVIDEFGNLTENAPAEYANYVEYCMMDSYTCNATTTMDLYPGFEIFVIDDYLNKITANTKEVLTFVGATDIEILYGNPDVMHHINQGYVLREEFDLAVKKDVYNATLEINGKTQVYAYDKRQANADGDWEIEARLSDYYYDATYSREIYREDYEYKTDDYTTDGLNSNFDATAAGVSQENELKVYVTYKLTIRNQSETLAGRVTEIVDYYDQEYTFVQERTYLGDRNGNRLGDITGSEHSIYGLETETTIPGYNNVYLTGMDEVLLDPDMQKDCYVYVTFLVNKDSDRNIILDEELSNADPIGVGKENIAEINGYKTFYGSKSKAPNEDNYYEDENGNRIYRTVAEYSGSEYSESGELLKQGDIAGKVDKDSVPGNLSPTDVPKDDADGVRYENFEDDTDKAPNIRIILNRENSRIIDGTVWEDERNVTEASAQVGDGLRTDTETGVNGVRVQLVELLENGQEYIWKEVNSGDTIIQTLIIDNLEIQTDANGNAVMHSYSVAEDGKYKFASFMPGNYIVRFIYGDGTSSVLGAKSTDYNTGNTIDNPVTNLIDTVTGYDKTSQEHGYNSATENIGLNDKSYNGQDYKSTTYQVGIDNGASAYVDTERGTFTYNFSASDGGLYSDAKDIWSRRQTVESYSTSDVTNHRAEVLASFERIPEYNGISYDAAGMASLLNEFLANTYMIAETGVIDVNFEYNRADSGTSGTGYGNIGSSNYEMSGYYNIANLDFGLQERPKSQLKITKQITNVKVTLANGSILFDASSRATNVLWNAHTAHGQDTKNTYTMANNYSNNFMKTPIVRQNAKDKGLIQLTMDEELMHGATIQVTYAITIANIGEVDYDENQFYYTGKVADTSTLVKTTPNTLIDYVGFQAESGNATRNNLQFNASQNPDWSVISIDELITDNSNDVDGNLINRKLKDNANTYTTIVKTDAAQKQLKPIIMDEENAKKIDDAFSSDPLNALTTVNSSESVVGVQLVLSQMLTSDNSSDDMTYNNLVEIVKTSNQVGRRMAYSVVGNQDPKTEPAEIDADDSQEVTILPPFGQSYIYYVLGGAVALILIVGIALVIRVVKKRR